MREGHIARLVSRMSGDARRYMKQMESAEPWLSALTSPPGETPHVIIEIYSPPHVTACAKSLPGFGIVPGLAFDLTTVDEDGVAWDFDIPLRRDEARRRIAEQKPMFLVCSPMCTAFCNWQKLNAFRCDPTVVAREWNKAMVYLQFV